MPPYKRKSDPNSVKAARALQSLIDRADQEGKPEDDFESELFDRCVTEGRSVSREEYFRFHYWLNAAYQSDDKESYCTLLQVWLDAHGIGWPKGVFSFDLSSSGPGRRKGLNRRLLQEQKRTRSNREIAQGLRGYEKKPDHAIQRVKDALRRPSEGRRIPLVTEVRDLALFLLGCDDDSEHFDNLRSQLNSELMERYGLVYPPEE